MQRKHARSNVRLLLLVLLYPVIAFSQQHPLLSSGPMLGYSEITEVAIWVQTTREADVQIRYWLQDQSSQSQLTPVIRTKADSDHIATFIITGLEFGKRYEYELRINKQVIKRNYPLTFQTQPHWRWRGDPPEFKFAIGSCAYFNEAKFDRPGTPYGGEYEIFTAIYRQQPDFMIWLGDNVYYREPDWLTEQGMRYRFRTDRKYEVLQPLFGSVHHYAIWDDHDFGPNDSDSTFRLKDAALSIHRDYWPQVVYGLRDAPGCFFRFEWGDVEFFMLDDRTYRSPNNMPPGAEKRMLGKAQLQWLKESLLNSKAPFKIIANGGQMINPLVYFEGWGLFPDEQKEFLDFLVQNKIQGVLFLSGDRHATELLKITPEGGYPLYEYTSSPLTSTSGYVEREANNPARVTGTWVTRKRNFGMIHVHGKRGERKLVLQAYDKDGTKLWEHTIQERELRFPQ